MVKLFAFLGPACALISSASAASCYTVGDEGGCSVSQVQTAASVICNGGTNYDLFCGSQSFEDGEIDYFINAGFSGTSGSRSQCWVSLTQKYLVLTGI
jgi:hypothetical protein